MEQAKRCVWCGHVRADDRLLAIASLVNGYHNGAQSDAPGVLRAIADALGPPFERSPEPPPPTETVTAALAQGRAEAEATIAQQAQEIATLTAERDRLKAELELRRRQMSRFPFCADHRDKVFGHSCYACRVEQLELAALKAERGTP